MSNNQYDLRNLEIIEKDFDKVLEQMGVDFRVLKFKGDFQKLLLALKDSHDRERKACTEFKGLSENLSENAGKMKIIMSMSQQDSKETEKLKVELTEAKAIYAWQMKKEETSLKKISALEITLKK